MYLKSYLFVTSIFIIINEIQQVPIQRRRQDAGPTNRQIEKTLEKALEIVRTNEYGTTRRPLRQNSSPIDKDAKAVLDMVRGMTTEEPGPSRETVSSVEDSEDSDYCPDKFYINNQEWRKSTIENILKLHESGRSEKNIRKLYPRYRRQYLGKFRSCLDEQVRPAQALALIGQSVSQKFKEAREEGKPVRGFMIKAWAIAEARELGLTTFKASNHWLTDFKRKYGIRSRKVTKVTSSQEQISSTITMRLIDEFRNKLMRWRRHFKSKFIWNMDQTSVNYEQSTDRTLSFVGERDTYLHAGSKLKQTHSYTSQITISRSGRLVGKLLLCLQEPTGVFGPRVGPKVHELESEYGNIVVFASRSGKMTSELNQHWVSQVVKPAFEEISSLPDEPDECPLPIDQLMRSDDRGMDEDDEFCRATRYREGQDTCKDLEGEDAGFDHEEICRHQARDRARLDCLSPPSGLLLVDGWTGNKAITIDVRLAGLKQMNLPDRSTSELQPLDVGFMRQYKLFIGRLTSQAHYDNLLPNITTREGIINMQSLIWNQFNAPAYYDMIKWCWHKTDLNYESSELRHPTEDGYPLMVRQIQFNFNDTGCQVLRV